MVGAPMFVGVGLGRQAGPDARSSFLRVPPCLPRAYDSSSSSKISNLAKNQVPLCSSPGETQPGCAWKVMVSVDHVPVRKLGESKNVVICCLELCVPGGLPDPCLCHGR